MTRNDAYAKSLDIQDDLSKMITHSKAALRELELSEEELEKLVEAREALRAFSRLVESKL